MYADALILVHQVCPVGEGGCIFSSCVSHADMLLNQGIIIGSDGLIARHHRCVMIGSTARYPENVTLTGSHRATRFASVNLCLLPIKLICDMYHLNYVMLVLINHYDKIP